MSRTGAHLFFLFPLVTYIRSIGDMQILNSRAVNFTLRRNMFSLSLCVSLTDTKALKKNKKTFEDCFIDLLKWREKKCLKKQKKIKENMHERWSFLTSNRGLLHYGWLRRVLSVYLFLSRSAARIYLCTMRWLSDELQHKINERIVSQWKVEYSRSSFILQTLRGCY